LLSDPKDAAFLFEMHRCLTEIAEVIEGEDRDVFLADLSKPHRLAVVFLMLGEAANRISCGTWARHPEIEWQRIANLRHLIAHEYRKVDHAQLWQIATTDARALARILPSPPSPADIF
jgi:uncharacterized protein with HEPN domain